MADDALLDAEIDDSPPARRKRRWAKRIGWALAIILMPFVLVGLFLSTPIGKRWVTDQIADVAPASGLRFDVGRIEGDIYGQAVLHDVTLSDPKGPFLTIPEVELDWNPLAWLWSGLDIRNLTARRGKLERLPELLPGDPDAPILPDFDIRVDHFEIDNLTIAPGVASGEAERVDVTAEIDIRKGRVLVDAKGTVGREDRLALLIDAEPDGDRFDLALDYRAAADGPMVGLIGLDAGYVARVKGDGSWRNWLGHALVTRQPRASETGASEQRVAAFQITNSAGQYGLLGKVTPTLSDGSLLDRALGDGVSIALSGTLEDSTFDGDIAVVTSALDLRGNGAVDLADNRFKSFATRVAVRDPALLGEGAGLENAQLVADLDGAFRDLSIKHELAVERLVLGSVTLEGFGQSSTARFDGSRLALPLNASAARIVTGSEMLDEQLTGGTLRGNLSLEGARLVADSARLNFPNLAARVTFRGDLDNGVFAVGGPIEARALALDGIGTLSGNAKLLARFGNALPWSMSANLAGTFSDVRNPTLASVAGEELRFRGSVSTGANRPITFAGVELESERLTAKLESNIIGSGEDRRTTIAGSGQHQRYGPFTIEGEIATSGPRAQLVLADPLPAAGLRDVRIAIAPSDSGFALDVAGGSLLGPFDGALGLALPADSPAQIAIRRLNIYRTNVTGALALRDDGIVGDLAIAGGGLNGTLALAPNAGGAQGFNVALTARQARFGGETPIGIANADLTASGAFGDGPGRISANIRGTGFEYGTLTLANFAAKADVRDGAGKVTASIAGRRSEGFSLKLDGDIAPQRIALLAQGEFANRSITMPRRAVLTALDDGGWQLAPAQVSYARGHAIVEGRLGGAETALEAKLSQMPLRLADLFGTELGLGGRLSGIVNWRQSQTAPPTGNARVRIDEFSRSGLLLSSTPIDVLAVAELSQDSLTLGARLRDGETSLGKLDARVTAMARSGDLGTRVMNGRLAGALEYEGTAAALWRLVGVEAFDLTGPVAITAKATGTAADPRITGNLASDDLRLQSAISGTDIDGVSARGRFVGSRLELTRFSGATRGDGTINGSGFIDFAGMSRTRGPQIDIRASATRARLLAANGLNATLTGPLRILSNGSGGTIAGRVKVDRASWRLGIAAEDMSLPDIATREVNRADTTSGPTRARAGQWRYLVDASAPSRVAVDGLGLDSEWGIDIVLRGTVDDPRIGGEARLVRGDYTFAGTRFDLTRGRITFDENVPIDPRLDLLAEADANGTDVSVTITGNAQTPEVAFSSVPALPEEEILARLLFGGSVTSLSPTDAVQLAAAVTALRGGEGGIDPIGDLRRSIGLDQLRIVSADPALGRDTGVAIGKNVGRRVYIEIVTDGRGYSATSVEYRVTRWLALLGTVSTIGRDSVLAEVSKDY